MISKRPIIHLNTLIIILMLPLVLGCAVAALTAAGASLGVSYSITNIAYKTFNFPLGHVDKATVEALEKMDFTIVAYNNIGQERKIVAAAKDLDIRIKLARISSTTTQIRVDARKWPIFKDKATALEIICQVYKILDPKGLTAMSPE